MHCALHAIEAHNLLEMWWCLANDGRQRLTQSRGETSSIMTDDGFDLGGSLNMGLVGPTKTFITMKCPTSDTDVKIELDVPALVFLPFY